MTIAERPPRPCPDAETLALLADGRLSRAEVAELMEHVAGCEDCAAAVGAANEVLRESAPAQVAPKPRTTWWLAAAAAVLIASAISFVMLRDRSSAPLAGVIALMPDDARPADARLSGGFAWAPYRGPLRAEGNVDDATRMRLVGAAGDLVERASRDTSANAQQAAGVSLVVVDQPLQAVERLRAAVQAAPENAAAWSDLAAAQSSAALHFERHSLLPEALASADRALRLDPRLPEALFNRAVVLERLGLVQQARDAWQAYLGVDNTSRWATEARERLARIPPPSSASQDVRQPRAYAEVEQLGKWAEAERAGNAAAAEQALALAGTVGYMLERRHGEALLGEAVRAIESGSPSQRARLADAHLVYRRGRIAYSRQQLDDAQEDLARAAVLFRDGGSPMALVARYYAANVRFDRNDVAGARRALEVLLAEVLERPRFIAIAAQVRWELALCLMVDGDWNGALPLLEASRQGFSQLGERGSVGFVESLLADTTMSLGRPDEAWAARTRAFTAISVDGRGALLPVSIKAAAQMELRGGRPEVARALLALERTAARAIDDDMLAADALVRSTLVNAALGDREAAAGTLREATAAVAAIDDRSLAALARGHLQLASAATVLASDPASASRMLTQAIDIYRAADRPVFLPECYLLRARAALQRGEREGAAADLESGIAAVERSPVRFGAVVGTGALDAGVALFDDAIRLGLDRGDADTAFRYIERSRLQAGEERYGTARLRKQLAGSATAVLELAVLPDELVAICVTAGEVKVARRPLTRGQLDALVARVRGRDVQPLAELYDLAIRPFAPLLASSRHLIVVADPRLEAVPFAALYDSASRRFLVEQLAVSMAMSASALARMEPAARGTAIAVRLPPGDAAALAETTFEIGDVVSLHDGTLTLESWQATFPAFVAAAADRRLIHVAGHTQRHSGDAGPSLFFAGGRVAADTIARQRFAAAPVVVLAACETLRRPASPNVRALSLGAAFLAAGASDIVGTLAPIADADARTLFRSIHQRLARGDAPAEAVRAAQLEALQRGDAAWHVVASLTRRIAV